ncbi:AMP-binding protein [Actinomadura sp. 7K507]|uniref:AMP-binding protein n=1 Tax=Actinomadura sp. 7K507 TaxID=2530365 RepID=UPI001404442E|nr:AMP-binding protein [Actinomadura sp. 7K507]
MDLATMNFRSFFEEAAAHVPERPYLIWTGDDSAMTYAEFDTATNRAANAWTELGVRPGDRVAFMLDNSPQFLVAWLGLAKIGACLVAINTGFRHDEASYLVGDSEARFVLTSPAYLPVLDGVQREHATLGNVLTLEEHPGHDAFAALQAAADTIAPKTTPRGDDLISLIYTSGTTGHPKGVMQTHSNFVLTGQSYPAWMGMADGDRIYACLPLFHINSQAYSTMGAIGARGAVVLAPRFSASRFWPEVRRHRAAAFNYIGAMAAILSKKEPAADDRDHSVRVAYGVPAHTHETRLALEKRFGMTIISGFGMSETTFGLAESLTGERRPDSMGTPRDHPDPNLPRTEARIVDDDGNDVPPGTHGELLLRNAAMMRGYFNDPAKTAEALDPDGWLHTGDNAWMDEDGFFYFVDRKKDIVRRRGENISSLEVERVVEQHPGVLEAAVIGVPSELSDEEVLAYVVRRPGAYPGPEEIVEWCADHLAPFKIPRFIEFVDQMPKTPTSKIQKDKLRRLLPGVRYDREAATSTG